MSKPVEIEFLLKDGLSSGIDKIGVKTDALGGKASTASAEFQNVQQQVMNLRNVIAMLEAQLEELRLVGQTAAPDLDQSTNISQIEALEMQIEELEAELKRLQNISESTDVVPPQLPQAEKKFNGLHNSIQQMAREMPSLAMGPQMFFMAISNNLPIFADEVGRARKEYDALIKSGQKGTPVWKQILSSLFSWQTALTTGIMLLVMYGDEIVAWTKDLFSAKKGVEDFNISMEEMIELEKDGRAQMVKTRFELDTVIASLKNFTGSKEEEKAKVEELNRKYGEAFGYYDTIAQWYDILTQKSEDYIQMLFLQAKAQAMVNKAVEADAELQKLKQQKPGDADSDMNWFAKMGHYAMAGEMAQAGQYYDAQGAIDNYNQQAYEEMIQGAEAKLQGYLDEAAALTEQAAQVGKNMDIGGHVKPDAPSVNPQRETDQRLAAQNELSERMLELQRQNQLDSINLDKEGLQQKLAQIDFDYETRKAEIERHANELSELNKESGGDGSLTDEQQALISEAHDNNLGERQRATAEAYRAEFEAMQEHLKEYGTFQQQKLAITEEYAERIRNATTEGERLSLTVERDSALANIEAQELRANINWDAVFGEFGGMFSDMITPVLQNAKKYMQTSEFQNADQASQESLVAAVQQMEKALGGANKVSFKNLGTDIKAYQRALADLREAQIEYGAKYGELTVAQKAYIEAMRFGTKEEQQIAEQNLQVAQTNADAAAQNVESMQNVATEAQRTMTGTATTLKTSMDGVISGLQKIASGSISGAYNGLIELGNSAKAIGGKLGDAFGKVADTLEDVPIIGWIVSIIDLFKDGLSIVIGGILDAVFNAVSGIIGDILSGDLFVTIGKSLLSGIGKILDSITWGGFSSWTDSSNAKEVQDTINRLTERNELLQTAIEDLTDEISASKGTKSVAAYKDALKLQQETNSNYLGIAQAQAGYHSAHHSWNYYWDGFSQEQIDRLSEQIGRKWDGDIWSLSPEEMKMLRSNVDMWQQIQDTGKGGYGERLTEKLNDYIEQADKIEELTDQLYEGLTGISFDGMYSSFVDNLMDMKYDAKAAADDISEYFMRAMLSNKIGEMYSDKLKEWWEKFGKAMEDNELSETERQALAEEYMGYVNEAITLRDNLAAATGYGNDTGTSQSGKAGAFSAMSQEQGSKLEGLFVSGQIHWASIDERMEDVSETMSVAVGHLRRIEENTDNCKDSLSEIKGDIKKMIRDGIKVK